MFSYSIFPFYPRWHQAHLRRDCFSALKLRVNFYGLGYYVVCHHASRPSRSPFRSCFIELLCHSVCSNCCILCLLHASFFSTRNWSDEALCPQSVPHAVCMVCSPHAGQSAACFQSKFNLIKETHPLDLDFASIFWPFVRSRALERKLFHFIIKSYNREKIP